MSYQTFNQEQFDHTKEPIFFGRSVNVARYDRLKYPTIDGFSEHQMGFFWRPQEIDLTRDRQDFNQKMDDAQRHIFTSNLKYQTLLDSVQGRSLMIALLKLISIPEMENWVENWSFSETIHSRSYTHIIRNLYADPGVIFDDIVVNSHISERATSVTQRYDRVIAMSEQYIINMATFDKVDLYTPVSVVSASKVASSTGEGTVSESFTFTKYELMKELYLLLIDIYALESLRFFVSFACSFAFSERKLMEGNAKIIRLICRDECLHREATAYILNLLSSGREGEVWTKITQECRDEVPEIFNTVCEQEKNWAKYLFKDGSMIGLNEAILGRYVDYRAGLSMNAIGITNHGIDVVNNPLPWMSNYTESDALQVAPQEAENSSYMTADLNNDLLGSIGDFASELLEGVLD